MTASTRIDVDLTAPIVDYEPAPIETGATVRAPKRLQVVADPEPGCVTASAVDAPPEVAPPTPALMFADAALRRVLEVSDRRRPMAQLRPLVTPTLFDAMSSWPRHTRTDGTAALRRVRMRTARERDGLPTAVEVFATFSRGPRLHAAAGRIEMLGGRWQFVALQLG
ncbi:Rv3235 family protein [Mycolicibacterium sp. lyk4-40-TYG-92]|uniref:Rv3235 family protein n=1 Tax=Mycolicibacterium sp. lyk4-40-TYG-92 TaxID=3040295 RepID=UPI00254DC958|nr:Rv3235 family protein [Mycolicibacterium sp. lyk4-40-TYG-92]